MGIWVAFSPALHAGDIPKRDTGWVSTWTGSPSGPVSNTSFTATAYKNTNDFNNQTLRLIVHASLGGQRVRVSLSNELGTTPLVVGAVHIALQDAGPGIVAGTDRILTFNGGEPAVTIPPSATELSDPVLLDVPALANLAVSLYLPDMGPVNTAVPNSQQTSYVAPPGSGDTTGLQTLPLDPVAPAILQWPILTRVDIRNSDARTLVAFGSSITLAVFSTVNANARWTDVLAARLNRKELPVSVVNASIVADHLSVNGPGLGALARLDRDALSQPGIAYLFINDILGVECHDAASPGAVIAGLRQVVKRAHSRNVKVYVGTITPLGGSVGYSDNFEANRQGVNDVIRHGGEVDGFVDFDAVLRDPSAPIRILPGYDGGDHHHPNDLGNRLLGQAFDLALFQ